MSSGIAFGRSERKCRNEGHAIDGGAVLAPVVQHGMATEPVVAVAAAIDQDAFPAAVSNTKILTCLRLEHY